MPLSSWLFGEITPAGTSLECDDGVNPISVPIPQGARYLHDDTALRSLIDQLALEIDGLIGSPSTTAIIVQRDRHIRIDVPDSPGNFSVDWTGNEDLRDALGFAANLSGATSYTAPNVSPYLWCPGLTEISKARLGRQGVPVYDTQIGGGGSFTKPVMTTSQYRVNNKLSWRNVINTLADGRVWALSEPDDLVGGEHFAFWHAVLLVGGQFTHYRATENDETSTADVGLSSVNRRGPYAWAVRSGDVEYDYDRAIQNVEARSDVAIDVTQVTEL